MDTRPRLRRAATVLGRVALLALAAHTAHARIFERLGPVARDSYASFPGWSRAYEAPLVINGARASLAVWNAPEPLPAAMARLDKEARRAGGSAAFFPGVTQAWGISSVHGQLDRLFGVGMDSGRRTLVFRFSQPQSEAGRARLQPSALPREIPILPGATPEFIAVNEESGTTLAVFTAPGAPADAAAFLGRSLEQAGWTPALGPGSDRLGSMGFYLRRNSFCGFSAKMSGHDGSCVVTVLHRRLKTGVFD